MMMMMMIIIIIIIIMGWTVRHRILVGARFSTPVQTGPGTQPVSYKMGTGYLSRG
jgi:hypothetical protein